MTQNDPVIEELSQALHKKNLRIVHEISFPRYNIWPDEVRLALKVLQKNGMKISFVLSEIEKK